MSFATARIITVLLLTLTTLTHAQLGQRVLEVSPEQVTFQTSEHVTCTVEGKTVIAKLDGASNSWLTTQNQYPLNDNTTFEIQCDNGQVGMQIEWFTSRGRFISASDILKASDFKAGKQTLTVNDHVPADIVKKTRFFRPKFWLYDNTQPTTFKAFAISAPRQFRTSGLQLEHKWEPTTRLTPDRVLTVKQDNGVIDLTLDSSSKHAGLVFEDRVPWNAKGVAMIDIHSFPIDQPNTSLALQTICWDEQGNYLTSIDLIKNMNKAGTYEISPGAYGSAVPEKTVKINFKVWIWGNGKEAKCKINGIYWGTPGSSPGSEKH